jgi:exopolyphosphatase/guanosine-5'-triphosphate,3'-diphosphate pyrophosphatase
MSHDEGQAAAPDSIVAAFDLGSNSIKMTVARAGAHDAIDEFLWRTETVRLGQGIDQTGRLADDRIAAALDTLARFATEARAEGATRLIGVATEAARAAANGAAFLERVRDETGIDIRTITGDREAQLTFLGLDGVVDLRGRVVIADIGGASTELIFARDERIAWSHSFALGSGRLTDRLISHDPPRLDELAACRDAARQTVHLAPFDLAHGGRLIVVGGTGEYLDRLTPEGAARDRATLDGIAARLTDIPAGDLATMLSIQEARARVLPAGVAAVQGLADLAEPVSFSAAQSGIRRGLLHAAFAGAW